MRRGARVAQHGTGGAPWRKREQGDTPRDQRVRPNQGRTAGKRQGTGIRDTRQERHETKEGTRDKRKAHETRET